jgi:hypothetical protein
MTAGIGCHLYARSPDCNALLGTPQAETGASEQAGKARFSFFRHPTEE